VALRRIWCFLSLVVVSFATSAHAADLTVRLDARDVVRKRVHTDMTLAVAPGALTLVFPKWIPGEHAPSGPLDSMIGLVIKANGQPLAWARDPLDIYGLKVTVPRGVDHLEISLDSGLATEGDGFSAAPTSSAQLAVLPLNEFVLLPKGKDAETISTSVTVIPPPGWVVASALDVKAIAENAYEVETASLTRVIDSPVQIGRHMTQVDLAGSEPLPAIAHSISIAADSEAALAIPLNFQQGYSALVAEAGKLFGSRMYRHYTWILSLSDHVAHFGLEHNESSDNRREERTLIDPELTPWLAQLLGHEYVHSWNGKYRRPQGLLSPDYQKPMDGSLLWVYEGLTEFWGDVLSTRAGLLTPDQYRESLAYLAGVYDTEPGAQWRPLADTAVAAQELYNSPEAFRSSRRDTDFYDGSVFLWLDVDSEIRARTQGRASLDDFMKRFYAGESGAPQVKPYVEQDVYDTLSAVAPGGDWRAFVRRHLDTPDTKALFGALERSGWKLSYTREKNAWIEYYQKRKNVTLRQWSIGLNLDKDALITDVFEGRPAAKAGIGPGMTLVAVNGKRYTPDVLDAAMVETVIAHDPIELLVVSDDYFRTVSVPYHDGPRYPHLERAGTGSDQLSAVLSSRVVGSAPN
jgi:predicted metalloprotease with PDZ domain